jgi:hypothetical protein
MHEEKIPAHFIQYAADLLGDTSAGLSGPNIVKAMAAYAVEFDVDIPHPAYPFDAPNKRTALYENLMAFAPGQQCKIIRELCDHDSFSYVPNQQRKELKVKLATRYHHLASSDEPSEINETLIEETQHWLGDYPEVLSLYNEALEKYEHGIFHRNLLDDLRLALEKLLCAVFGNGKSLENQIKFMGGGGEDGALVLLQDLEPACDVCQVVLAGLQLQAKVGRKERAA